ncbi:RNA polymerase sigma factor [Nocardioides salsibiostraticola]
MTTDSDVLRRSRTDPAAFTEIFERHFVTIHRYLARRTGSGGADDLAAEVFTIAFSKRGSFDLERPDALPWLYGIAGNLLNASRRRHSRDIALLTKQPRPEATEPFERGVDASVDAARQVRRLDPMLRSLSPDDLSTLVLYAWEELTYAEIAEALGVPVGTVRSRLNRVRRRLREPTSDLVTSTGQNQTDSQEGVRDAGLR